MAWMLKILDKCDHWVTWCSPGHWISESSFADCQWHDVTTFIEWEMCLLDASSALFLYARAWKVVNVRSHEGMVHCLCEEDVHTNDLWQARLVKGWKGRNNIHYPWMGRWLHWWWGHPQQQPAWTSWDNGREKCWKGGKVSSTAGLIMTTLSMLFFPHQQDDLLVLSASE